jgi:hypothetical protein
MVIEDLGVVMTTTITATVATNATLGPTASIGLLTTLLLFALLLGKEIAVAMPTQYNVRWGRILTIGSAPLLISVAISIGVRLLAVF